MKPLAAFLKTMRPELALPALLDLFYPPGAYMPAEVRDGVRGLMGDEAVIAPLAHTLRILEGVHNPADATYSFAVSAYELDFSLLIFDRDGGNLRVLIGVWDSSEMVVSIQGPYKDCRIPPLPA